VESLYGIRHINREAIVEIVRRKMRDFGFCLPSRSFDPRLVVPFGSSEIISVCMRAGTVDCAVVVCDGVGTVITDDPDLVQGIGARLNGILKTSPIAEVVERVKSMGGRPLDEERASIDQPKGVRVAAEMGFRRIAVTVIGPRSRDIPAIRKIERRLSLEVSVFSTCSTLVREEVIPNLRMADIVCSSASRIVRERIGPKSIVQLGVSIPVFVLTQRGKELAFTYLKHARAPLLVSRARLPFLEGTRQPRPLFGENVGDQ